MGSITHDGKAGTGCSSSSNCRKSFDDQAARASSVDGAPKPITARLLAHSLSCRIALYQVKSSQGKARLRRKRPAGGASAPSSVASRAAARRHSKSQAAPSLDCVTRHDADLADWTGLNWYIDVHVIDRPAADDLRRLRDAGWICINVTDTAHTETSSAKDEITRHRLEDQLLAYPIAMGPLVLDHSLLDLSVIGGVADKQRLRNVFAALWPTNDYEDDAKKKTARGRTRFRDAMHVATAIRYSGTGFITEDSGILKAAARIASEFNGFIVLSIAEATERSFEVVRRVRRGAEKMGIPEPTSLPDWP